MKTKVFLPILIMTFLSFSFIGQAQDKYDRATKRELRKVKREMRKAEKQIEKSMEDIQWFGIHDHENWVSDEDVDHYFDAIDHFNDEMENFKFEWDELAYLEELEPLKNFEFVMPEIDFHVPEFEYKAPKYYEVKNYFEESGSVLELSKDLDDVSISKDFFFEVSSEASILDMKVDGSLGSGDMTITVKNPEGEVFQKFQISPLADVAWAQQFELEEGDKKVGKWTINLSGTSATGNYSLRFKAR